MDGHALAVFELVLREGDDGPAFSMTFGTLNQCKARIRIPVVAATQGRWRYAREGAWLKPTCGGQSVDLRKVNGMSIAVARKSEQPVRWCLTPITATVEEPPRLDRPSLPAGVLIDELGQSAIHDWPSKSRDTEEVTERLHAQLAAATEVWPPGCSRWGGCTKKQLRATGYFRTAHDQDRWWLVDPDGYIFWSIGQNCVRVDTDAAYSGLESALAWMPDRDGPYAAYQARHESVPTLSYLATNLIRAFGETVWYERWAAITVAELRRTGFNTIANWSDWEVARAAQFPYVRTLDLVFERTPYIFRDFPDVFHPAFLQEAARLAEPLRATAADPALIGYFLMNEPSWGFGGMTPAAGMLFATEACATRKVWMCDGWRTKTSSARYSPTKRWLPVNALMKPA